MLTRANAIGSFPRSYDDASGVESSALRALSFATIRFFAVIRQTMKAAGVLPAEVGETQECEGLRVANNTESACSLR